MDPNANLNEQLSLAASIREDYEDGCKISEVQAARLAELAIALNEWVTRGGFLPERWSKAPAKPVKPEVKAEVKAAPQYEVIVGNVGSLWCADERHAIEQYEHYVAQSTDLPGCRCYGESVTMMCDGEPIREHIGHQDHDDDDEASE